MTENKLTNLTSQARSSAPLIAIVGSDGSGKSTVGEALLAWMRESGPVELCHLGKQSGNIGRVIARWPLVGKRLDRTITVKTEKAQSTQGPGAFTALVVYAFSLRRLFRFRRMLALRQSGMTILADRFPQIEIPGAIDGPGFSRLTQSGALSRLLARRELKIFEWMVSHRPTLIIRLNVDVDTAFARKPDHSYAALKKKIEDIRRLKFNGATIVDIDATLPLDQVLAQAKQAISAATAHD